jgi:hypothetical protein
MCKEGVKEGRSSSDLWSVNAERWLYIGDSAVMVEMQLEGVHFEDKVMELGDIVGFEPWTGVCYQLNYQTPERRMNGLR